MEIAEPLVYLFLSLLLFAFFSGVEIAFVSANRLEIELEKKQGGLGAKIQSFFATRPTSFISAMLIGGNIALVSYGILFARLTEAPLREFLQTRLGLDSEGLLLLLLTLAATLLIVVTGEYLPKSLFRINPNRTLKVLALPALLAYTLLYPIGVLVVFVTERLLRWGAGYKPEADYPVFGRTDLDHLIKEATQDPSATQEDIDHEFYMLKNALEFVHTKVRDCMVPRTEIEAVAIDSDLETLREKFVETGLSKLLLYEDSIDHIVGYVHSFALFKKPKDIRSAMMTPLIVPESMPVKEILGEFIGRRKSMAVVVDEFGGTAGILTMEDVVEEIFGEIEDEHDSEELTEVRLSDNEYLFSGRQEIRYLNEKYRLGIPENDEYSTLAGFIIHARESLPDEGETVAVPPFELEIIRRDGGKIDEVKLRQKVE